MEDLNITSQKRKKRKGLYLIDPSEENDPREIELTVESLDMREIFYISPELDKEDLKKKLESKGFEVTEISENYFAVDLTNITREEFLEKDQLLKYIKEEFKLEQLNFYDSRMGAISLPSEIIKLVSEFITETNKKRNIDAPKTFSVLQNILGNIYETQDGEVKFLDKREIDFLAKASVSRILEETELNLEMALKLILVKIRKLFISWIYDKLDVSIYNYHIPTGEVGIIERGIFRINGKIYKIFRLSGRFEADTYVGVSNDFEILTFNLGKKRKQAITPMIFMTILDQIKFHTRLELIEIYTRSLENLEKETLYDLMNLKEHYDEYTLESLEEDGRALEESIEFLYRLTNDILNDLKTKNRVHKTFYRRQYSDYLSKEIFLGGIPSEFKKITPIITIEKLEEATKKIEEFSHRLALLKANVSNNFADIIKSKKENNPNLFKKAIQNIKDFAQGTLAEIGFKIYKDITGDEKD